MPSRPLPSKRSRPASRAGSRGNYRLKWLWLKPARPRWPVSRHNGEGWWTGELYVAAKPFAEALQAHDEMVAQPESRNRKWLYRMLDERDLIVTNGGQRIWPLFVTGPGEPLPRFVSALKLAPALYAGLELGPVFQGSVEPARAGRAGRGDR